MTSTPFLRSYFPSPFPPQQIGTNQVLSLLFDTPGTYTFEIQALARKKASIGTGTVTVLGGEKSKGKAKKGKGKWKGKGKGKKGNGEPNNRTGNQTQPGLPELSQSKILLLFLGGGVIALIAAFSKRAHKRYPTEATPLLS